MKDIRGMVIDHAQAMADEMAGLIKSQVKSGTTPPPNAPSTISRKGHEKTLVDTGETSDSILAKVIISPATDEIVGEIGLPPGKVTEKWLYNEYGVPYSDSLDPVPGQRIPTRAAWRKTFDKNVEAVTAKHSAALLDDIVKNFMEK